jgi:hypothetical protein
MRIACVACAWVDTSAGSLSVFNTKFVAVFGEHCWGCKHVWFCERHLGAVLLSSPTV